MSGPVLLALRFALTVTVYAFLGWALFVLWQDLRRQSQRLGAPQVPPLTLTLQGEDSETPYLFNVPEVTIGRALTCECHLEDRTISAQHARLSYHHNQWWVEDLRSRNGTFLNQEVVAEPLVITSGDQLRCGQVVFELFIGEVETAYN